MYSAEIERLKADLRKANAELQVTAQKLSAAEDDLKHWRDACWLCGDQEYGIPQRHVHEVTGKGVVGHWHHYLDPGDGLPSPCRNSDWLEEVFRELLTALQSIVEPSVAEAIAEAVERTEFGQ
jgi:hypothetical protein